ncbi:hypothetical protein NL108_018290 [Boleophthalmus pectinirostris]|nr:hypothetical protein NL108_018290 [Boleophthalmus pectinirostris]
MESRDKSKDSAQSGPRDQSSAPNSPTTRGRKRDRNNLTTPEGGSDVRDRSKDLYINFKKPRLTKRGLRSKKVPSRGNAPPAANVTTPTSAFTPPTPSLTPPTPSLTPPTPSLTPPTPSLTPPTPSLTPPTHSLTDHTHSLTDPAHSLTDPAHSLTDPAHSLTDPPTPSLTPPSITVIKSRAKVFEEDDRRVNKEPCYSLWSQRFFVDKEELKQRIVQLLLR